MKPYIILFCLFVYAQAKRLGNENRRHVRDNKQQKIPPQIADDGKDEETLTETAGDQTTTENKITSKPFTTLKPSTTFKPSTTLKPSTPKNSTKANTQFLKTTTFTAKTSTAKTTPKGEQNTKNKTTPTTPTQRSTNTQPMRKTRPTSTAEKTSTKTTSKGNDKGHTTTTNAMSAKEFEKRLKAFNNKTFSQYLEVFKKVLKQKGQQLGPNKSPTPREKSSSTKKVTTTKKGSNKSPTQSEHASPTKKGEKSSPTQKVTKSKEGEDSVTTKTDTTTTKAGDNMKNGIGSNGGNDHAKSGPKFPSKTPESSHFAVVFLVLIALLFGLYALYHNRQKIIAVVVEGRSGHGRSARERYRKLDNSPEDNEVRIKNSNEVYVY